MQIPERNVGQRTPRETARVRAAAAMPRRDGFLDDFFVIKSLTEGNKNPTVPSAAEKLKPCSHLFIISEHARSRRRSPMAISVLSRFKLLAHTHTRRSADLPKLFLESERSDLAWWTLNGIRSGIKLVLLWSILWSSDSRTVQRKKKKKTQ